MYETVISATPTSRNVRYSATEPGAYPNPATTLVSVAAVVLPTDYYTTVYPSGYPGPVQQLTLAGQEVFTRLGELEAFNAMRFVNFTLTEDVGGAGGGAGSGGGGGGSGGAAQTSGFVTRWTINIAQQQVDSLNAAHDALRESVYGALVVQTRLRPYIDSVNLLIDANGEKFVIVFAVNDW